MKHEAIWDAPIDSESRPSCSCGYNGTPEECAASREPNPLYQGELMTTDNAPGADPMHTGERRRFDVPSTWIADKTGYNRQGIYRMRLKGNRDKGPMPMERMTRMEKAFGWSKADQYAALTKGRWIEEFEKVVAKAYAAEQKRSQ